MGVLPLFSIKDYPKITLVIAILVCIISIISETPLSDKFFTGSFAVLTTVLMTGYTILSHTAMAKLYKVALEKDEEIDGMEISDIELREILHACIRLDKYNVRYTIDLTNREIHADLSMGMYTRMSVANNLDSNVFYHITGTDIVLTKNNKDTNVQ